jgi:L-iditol 2-dehydrogenase
MRQAIMTAPGQILVHEVPQPVPGPGEVLLRVRRIGVCGSDIHVYHGLHPYTSYPVVQGHEVSAVVAAHGTGVDPARLPVGSQVTFMPQIVCGQCHPCRSGQYNICDSLAVMGFQAPGAAQDYFAIAAEKVLLVPETMSPEAAAMIEPLAVAVHALTRGGGVEGKKVAVIGAGPIGNLVAQTAAARGAASTLIMDKSGFRLSVARKCGVDHVVDATSSTLAEGIARHFGGDKADLILECVGAQATMDQAVLASRKGATIVVVGVFGAKPIVDLGLVQDRELTLRGTLMYRREDYEEAIALAASGRMFLDSLVTNSFRFEEYLEAYHFIGKAGDRAMKVMIALD